MARLWLTEALPAFTGEPGRWGNGAFSAAGDQLFVLYDDGRGFRWPMALGAWEQHACAVAGRNLTREEWARFVTGYPYGQVCPSQPRMAR